MCPLFNFYICTHIWKLVPIDAAVISMPWLMCLSSVIRSSSVFERRESSFWKPTVYSLFGFQCRQPSHCLHHEILDTVQVRPTWQEGELQRKAEFISCSCESYISTIPLCAVWQRRNDGCHLSYGLKEAVGKGIWILLEVCGLSLAVNH